MWQHMDLHKDVLGWLLTILKQDDYYRTLEELPVIDSLKTYDDLRPFPKLYDTVTIIERITHEADLIERQLRWPGMYPLLKTPIPSTSGFIPRPSSTFKPVTPATIKNINNSQDNYQSTTSSQQSSLPCGQRTPTSTTSNAGTPPQVAIPPRPATPQLQSNSTFPPLNLTNVPSIPWGRLQSPIRSDINPSAQSFIPAAVTDNMVSSTPEGRIPKSLNGEGGED